MASKGKDIGNGVYEFPYMRPPDRSKWENFYNFVYDPSYGTVLGRTGKSWRE